VTYDDHEVDNNWAGEIPEEGLPHDFFLRRRRAAFKAYREHMLGSPATFGAFQPGVAREYTASSTANVISTAGDAALSVSDPGHLANGRFTLIEPLRVQIAPARCLSRCPTGPRRSRSRSRRRAPEPDLDVSRSRRRCE
jgi:hypothetical protein